MFDSSIFKMTGAGRTAVLLALSSFARAALTVMQAAALSGALVALWAGGSAAGFAPAADGGAVAGGVPGSLPFGGGVAGCAAAFAAAFAVDQLVGLASAELLALWARRVVADLRDRVVARALFGAAGPAGGDFGSEGAVGRGFSAGGGTTSAELVDLVIEGADAARSYLELSLGKMVDLVVGPLVLAVALVVVDWVSGAIVLAAFPFIIIYMVLLGGNARELAGRRASEQGRLSAHFMDSVAGMRTLRAFGRARGHADVVHSVSERLRASTMRTLRTAMLSAAVLDLFATFSVAAVSVMLGFRLIDGTMELWPACMALIVAPEFFAYVRRFAADFHATQDGRVALERLHVFAQAPVVRDAAYAPGTWGARSVLRLRGVGVTFDTGWSGSPAAEGSRRYTAQAGETRPWSGLTAPEGSQRQILDIDLELRGFERVVVMGPSGAGKSTLLGLLAGFTCAHAGEIELSWDGVAPALAGSSLAAAAWRGQVLYLPQHPYIFHATLAQNVALYRPGATCEQIEQALDQAGLANLAARLPQGLNTMLGDGTDARRLSGGEAQRVALARALLDTSRRVLLLDEPTAHLDVQTELDFKRRLLPLMEGRLVVVVTHRRHWTDVADRVVELADGRVASAREGAR